MRIYFPKKLLLCGFMRHFGINVVGRKSSKISYKNYSLAPETLAFGDSV